MLPSSLRRITGVLILIISVLLSGCGLGTAGGLVASGHLSGPLANVEPLNGVNISVGSKSFTEQLILGKMSVILLKSAGANVQDLTNIPGSSSVRRAELGGELDMVWEYTGTAWIAYMGNSTPVAGEHQQWQAVKDADAKNGLTWLPPAPMNNTYGFAMTRANAQKLGITKMSQVKDIPVDQRSFCVEAEFNSRNDGMRPMMQTYDIPLGKAVPEHNVQLYDTGAIYAATAKGDCTFGEVFTTDGRIKALDLVVLEDDRHFFPSYNVSPVVREDVLKRYPQIAALMGPVGERLTNDVLMNMNARVDVNGEDPAKVAYEWLTAEGFVTQHA